MGGNKMPLAEAVQRFKEETIPCVYCGADMTVGQTPSAFKDMVIIDMPKHVCHQCKEEQMSAYVGLLAEMLQDKHRLQGAVTFHDLLRFEREDAERGETN